MTFHLRNRLEKVAASLGVSPEPYQKILILCEQYVASCNSRTRNYDESLADAMHQATAEAKQIYGEAIFNQIATELMGSVV